MYYAHAILLRKDKILSS